jgi:arylsulfatase A-like enzyme
MMTSLDQNVGRVLAALDAAGLADNTIVVFTSDNGGERFSDTWPLVGMKTELLEGGIRVPIIIRWPQKIQPGSRSDQVMISMDFLPTLYAAAGGKLLPAAQLDGLNLLDVLTGKTASRLRKLFWRYKARDQRAVRDGNWKYLKIDGKEYLFNLAQDQRERADLKEEESSRFNQLKKDFTEWNSEMLPYEANSYSHNIRDHIPL